ncbi:WXG100 family type VII secretion target [Nocardioides sp. Leaf285]|uniref:WXG100 family type VII secretion target n=1 Tax=Nocardioides sp. Leaf285 TaxID=1736322 RepID=UPI0007038177|nr:hypothetical protein [Nocardioides sp. Leaf285]KQP64090.1 hypothetical protein ASF47_08575 [Nocardioides sp. Leaf285]
MTDPLVAPEVDSTAWYTGAGPVESLAASGVALSEGDWVEGAVNGVFGGLETLADMTDPFGAVVGMIGGFIMEHVAPFPEWLDQLAGNPDEIRSFATTWMNVADHLDSNADDFLATVRRDAGRWEGLAVDAYTTAADALEDILKAFATAIRGVGGATELAGGIVAGVRALVRDAIVEVVSWILGAIWKFTTPYLPKGLQELASTVVEWVAKVRRFLDDLVSTVSQLGTRMNDLIASMGDGGAKVSEVLGRWGQLSVVEPGFDMDRLVSSVSPGGGGLSSGIPTLAKVTYDGLTESTKYVSDE